MNKKIICGYILSLLTITLGIAVMICSYKTLNEQIYLFNGSAVALSEYGLWMAAVFLILGVIDFFLSTVLLKNSESLRDEFIKTNRKRIIASIILGFIAFDLNITCSVNTCVLPEIYKLLYNFLGIGIVDSFTVFLAIVWLLSAVVINAVKLFIDLKILSEIRKYKNS